jgi:FlaA1/EpsC-like NDP-sugar epimerase
VPAVKAALVAWRTRRLAVASFAAAYALREGGGLLARFSFERGFAWRDALRAVRGAAVVRRRGASLSNTYYDLYRLRGEFSYLDECVRVFRATAVGSLLIVAWAFLYRGGFEFRAFSYARGVFVFDFFSRSRPTLLRSPTRGAQSAVRRREVNLIPTLVVGRGAEAALCVREMRARRELGYRVIGVVETDPLKGVPSGKFEGVPVVASDLAGLTEAIRETGANEVIITDPTLSGDMLFEVMMRVGRRGVEFRVAPSLFNCLPRKTEIDQIGVLPVITLFREPLGQGARVVKRASTSRSRRSRSSCSRLCGS